MTVAVEYRVSMKPGSRSRDQQDSGAGLSRPVRWHLLCGGNPAASGSVDRHDNHVVPEVQRVTLEQIMMALLPYAVGEVTAKPLDGIVDLGFG
jgi:hypothetical protein